MTDARRQTLKDKVEAGQARNRAKTENTTTIFDRAGEAAIEAKDKFTAFAKEHPIATVAGGVAVGILVAAMFKGPRRVAMREGSRAAKGATALAALGAELALNYAQQAMDAASEAREAGAKHLDGFGDTARSVGRDAAARASDAGESAVAITRQAGKRLGKAIRSRIN